MKISKSKQELARIISENGGWREGEFAAQDSDGSVGGYGVKPEWDSLAKYWWCEALGEWFSANKINNHHQTVLSRAEYFHLYQAHDADGWIEWRGGSCPVERGALVDVKYADNTINCGVSALTNSAHEDHVFGTCGSMTAANWEAGLPTSGIIAYRLHKSEPAKSTAVGEDETELAAKEELEAIEYKPTIEQLAADYRNKLDYANRKQDEADKANMDSDAALSQLEDAIAEIGFAITPLAATEKDPELVITDWRDLQRGDIIQAVPYGDFRDQGTLHKGGWAERNLFGKFAVFGVTNSGKVEIDSDRPLTPFTCTDDGGAFKFIRRP